LGGAAFIYVHCLYVHVVYGNCLGYYRK
jgi:hypothetical protein